MTNKPVYVTQPDLPPLEELGPYLEKIWDSKYLTNSGPFHQQLETALCAYLGVEQISLFANGTLALITAIQSLDLKGEVITTPFSFVATAHSLMWNGVRPVFVDIDAETLNLDPTKIEQAVTPETTAIMPVHCYGHPCDVEAISDIAASRGLKVIYDAAHAFGVQDELGSILRHGDLSVLSFHATKVFNTFEGGAIVSPDESTKRRIDQLRNFGFNGNTDVRDLGLNGKMSEFCSALGLVQLKHVGRSIEKRKKVDARYRDRLEPITGISCVRDSGETYANYSYFPILVKTPYPMSRDRLFERLTDNGIHARRYFYPLVSEFPMYKNLPSADRNNLTVAASTSLEILCLPIFPDLELSMVDEIADLIAHQ